MKRFTLNLIFGCLSIVALVTYTSCLGGSCDAVGPEGTFFSFRLVDPATGQNLIGDQGEPYPSDDVTLIDGGDGNSAKSFSIGNNAVSFIPAESDFEALDSTSIRIFYLGLPDPITGAANADIDTIDMQYTFRGNECPGVEYDAFTVWYNGVVVQSGGFQSNININKVD